jgi:hypothetical protein
MKTISLFKVICFLFSLALLTQCEKFGAPGGGIPAPDEDSDRPAWAGGNTDLNDHNKKDEGGTTGGSAGEYGDLYVLYRDINGVPFMTFRDADEDGIVDDDEYFVQPLSASTGEPIELDAYGEIPLDADPMPVDFGRLNIVRSPQSVLDQALGEALKVINAGVAFSVDFCGRLTIWNYNPEVPGELIITKTIDSPRESMALYQEIMNHGYTDQLSQLQVWNDNTPGPGIDPYILAASCFAAGSDKTGSVNIDEVVYINGFMGCLGCDSILNEHEYDFDNNNKWYFNFGDCDCHSMFQYNRDVYKTRMIKILVLDGVGGYTYDEVSVWLVMEGLWDGVHRFNGSAWAGDKTHVDGFATSVDDAVQVLEFVHGDSNIEFLPVTPSTTIAPKPPTE